MLTISPQYLLDLLNPDWKKELNKLLGSVRRDGFSVVPISIYFNDKGLAKLNIGLGKGKKKFDKRETQKMKDWNKTKQRLLKNS